MSARLSAPRRPDPAPGEPVDWRAAVVLFECLSHPGRLAVFRSLCKAGPDGVSLPELTRDVRTTGSALTFHLRSLETAGLVRTRPESVNGRPAILFIANREPLLGLIRLVLAEGEGTPDKSRPR